VSTARVMQTPRNYIDDRRLALDRLGERIQTATQHTITTSRMKFRGVAASLDALSPLKVLGRGYSITRDETGRVIKRAGDVKTGDKLTLRMQADEINCTVD